MKEMQDTGSKQKPLTIAVNTDKKKPGDTVELKSPASVEMKNSFIIKNSDPTFDTYATAMRRKKANMAYTNMGGTIFGLNLPTGQKGVSR
jgi:hypothetical protein